MSGLTEKVRKLWRGEREKTSERGLYATLPELLAERRNVGRLRRRNSLPTAGKAGDVKSAFKGRGIEMEEIRAYTPGDDVRDIDWRVTARKNIPYTKVYSEERDRKLYVWLDLSESMVFGSRKELKSVTACKIAALLGFWAEANKDRFGGVVWDGRQSYVFKAQNGRAELLRFLHKIAELSKKILHAESGATGAKSEATLAGLLPLLKEGAGLFVISDFADFDEEKQKTLALLAQKNAVFCIAVADALEWDAPKAGEYMAQYRNQKVIFDTKDRNFDAEYAKFFAERRRNLQNFCQKHSCRCFFVRTDVSIFSQLQNI